METKKEGEKKVKNQKRGRKPKNENNEKIKKEDKKENTNKDNTYTSKKEKEYEIYQNYIKEFLFSKNLEFITVLGEGTFGVVYEIKMANGHKAAAKIMVIPQNKIKGFNELKKRIDIEMGFSLTIHHENIIKSFFTFTNFIIVEGNPQIVPIQNKISVNNKKNNQANLTNDLMKIPFIFVIVLEKALHSSLNKIIYFLNKTNAFIPISYYERAHSSNKFYWIKYNNEHLIIFFLKQIVHSLECIYRNQFVHLDVKPENVLVSSGFILKLCDFSLIKQVNLYPTEPSEETDIVKYGTIGYLGPEYYEKRVFPKIKEDRVDVFALGSLLYHLVKGERLIRKESQEKIDKNFLEKKKEEINELETIYDCPEGGGGVLDLLFQMLDENMMLRPDIYEILSHDFLNKGSEQIKKTYNVTDIDTSKIFVEFQKIGYYEKPNKSLISSGKNLSNMRNKRFVYNKKEKI